MQLPGWKDYDTMLAVLLRIWRKKNRKVEEKLCSSQEDYLDNLLRDVAKENEIQEDVSDQDLLDQDIFDQDVPELDVEAPDLDAVSGMSEEEIDRLLSAGGAQEDTDFTIRQIWIYLTRMC